MMLTQGGRRKLQAVPSSNVFQIQNFLHLTPVAIKKHCEALKQFCTEWPSALDSEEKCMKHFPIQVQSKEFTVRIVTLNERLFLNITSLMNARYAHRTLSCYPPLCQSFSCTIDLFWSHHFVLQKTEEYEREDSPSQRSVLDAVLRMERGMRLKNEGETEENLQKYKEAVKKLFNIRGTKISSL
uniref:Uncharacterized protein n=1 Tax=Cyprinus carpio TaxID=7962 RepID=A0A8C1Q3Z1_CYPCA